MGTLIGVGLFTLAAVPLIALRFGLDCMVSLARYQRRQREEREAQQPPSAPADRS